MNTFLNVNPHIDTLKERLGKIRYAQNIKILKKTMSLDEFVIFLKDETIKLKGNRLKKELRDYFTEVELEGIDLKIRISLNRISEFLEQS